MKKILILGFSLGAVYFYIEVFWKLCTGTEPHVIMTLIGGLCGVAVGAINEMPRCRSMKIWKQSLLGAGIVLLVEFMAGYILNCKLHMNLWDYSSLPLNLLGQICLLYGILWFFLMPLAICLEDGLRASFFGEGKHYPWYENYIKLIKGE